MSRFNNPSPEVKPATFVRERADGVITLKVLPRRMYFVIKGALHSEEIVGIIADAAAAGLLKEDNFSALADMREFTGVVDWKVIPQISEVMPKGETRGNKNAYIVRDEFFDMLAKVNAALFPLTEHATFRDEFSARAWLGWD